VIRVRARITLPLTISQSVSQSVSPSWRWAAPGSWPDFGYSQDSCCFFFVVGCPPWREDGSLL